MNKQNRRVMEMKYGTAPSPFGPFFIVWTREEIMLADFPDGQEEACIGEMNLKFPGVPFKRDDEGAKDLAFRIFNPENNGTPGVCVKGTPFQETVWQTLQTIPFGTTISYSELAAAAGYPKAARAVASAVASNRIAYIIPCHRVVRSDGRIGKYRWGEERKKAIIEWENKK